jgi:hypothetical protein
MCARCTHGCAFVCARMQRSTSRLVARHKPEPGHKPWLTANAPYMPGTIRCVWPGPRMLNWPYSLTWPVVCAPCQHHGQPVRTVPDPQALTWFQPEPWPDLSLTCYSPGPGTRSGSRMNHIRCVHPRIRRPRSAFIRSCFKPIAATAVSLPMRSYSFFRLWIRSVIQQPGCWRVKIKLGPSVSVSLDTPHRSGMPAWSHGVVPAALRTWSRYTTLQTWRSGRVRVERQRRCAVPMCWCLGCCLLSMLLLLPILLLSFFLLPCCIIFLYHTATSFSTLLLLSPVTTAWYNGTKSGWLRFMWCSKWA